MAERQAAEQPGRNRQIEKLHDVTEPDRGGRDGAGREGRRDNRLHGWQRRDGRGNRLGEDRQRQARQPRRHQGDERDRDQAGQPDEMPHRRRAAGAAQAESGGPGQADQQARAEQRIDEAGLEAHFLSSSSKAWSSSRDSLSYSSRDSGLDSSKAAIAWLTDPAKNVRTTCDIADPRTSSAGAVGK